MGAVQESYRRYMHYGPQSDQKVKALHGWAAEELQERLGKYYGVHSLSDAGGREKKVSGEYYEKWVDIAISREGTTLGAISVNLVTTDYIQSKSHYFEQQLGETANLRRGNIVYGHIMVFPEPVLHLTEDGDICGWEHVVSDSVIRRYEVLARDRGQYQYHVPDAQCIAVFLLDEGAREVSRMCACGDLPDVSPSALKTLNGRLSIDRFFDCMVKQVVFKYTLRRD